MLAALMPKDVAPDVLLATDDAGEKLYYGDLPELAATWGERLPGRRLVALFCSNTVPSLRAYIGLQAAGHVVVLQSAKMSEQARSALIARYGYEASVDGDKCEILADPADNLHPDLSVCLSTSGSTGSPKLVRFSAKQLRANAEAIAQYLELSSEDAPLAHLPFEYSYGLSVLHSHMTVGATCLLTEHSVMQKPFWERLSQATSFSGVPFHFEMLLRMRLHGRSCRDCGFSPKPVANLDRKRPRRSLILPGRRVGSSISCTARPRPARALVGCLLTNLRGTLISSASRYLAFRSHWRTMVK